VSETAGTAAREHEPERASGDTSRNASDPDLEAVQRRESAALAVAYKTPEHAEAVKAFLEKRPPQFR